MAASRKNTRITLPPIVKAQIKRLEQLLKEAQATPTHYQQIQETAKRNPEDSFARHVLSRGIFGITPQLTLKVNDGKLTLRMRQALKEIAPNSEYVDGLNKKDSVEEHIRRVSALIDDLKSGALNSISHLAHAEAFDDVFDRAQHLLDEGYLVEAAVSAGTVGEAHIKNLAKHHGIALVDANNRTLAASRLNEELKGRRVYGKTHAKRVAYWQGIRNDAAHLNEQKNLTKDMVQDLIDGYRRFVRQYPV